jgi:Spy/CpxP family protein refolding chaperone
MRTIGVLILAWAGVFAFVGQAFAQAPQSQPARQGQWQCCPGGRLTEKLNLTPDQQAQMKTILDKAKADAANATDAQTRHQIWKDAWANIKTNVLTDQQRTQLAQTHRAGHGRWAHHKGWGRGREGVFQSLNLSPDQKAQVKAIMDQARTDAQNATDRQAKHQILQAAFEKIKTTVLTADQVKQLEAEKAMHHKGPCGKAGKEAPAAAPAQT